VKIPLAPSGMVLLPKHARRKASRPKPKQRKRKPRTPAPESPLLPRKARETGLVSVIISRLPRWKMDALRALSQETRVSQSDYLREAIEDVLRKHGTP